MSYPTHCPHGHVYDEINTRWQVRSNGHKTPSCKTCQRARYKKEYHTEQMKKWRAKNKEHAHKTWTALRQAKKAWLDEYKSNHPCVKCGESDSVCLDFHHINPKDKELTLSVAVSRASLERIQKEIAKCEILCANCHRKLHASERIHL